MKSKKPPSVETIATGNKKRLDPPGGETAGRRGCGHHSYFHPLRGRHCHPTKRKSKANKSKLLTSPFTRFGWYAVTQFQIFQGFCQGGCWAFQVNVRILPESGSRLNFSFVRVIKVNPFVFGFFHGPQHFCFFCPLQISCFSPLGANPCSDKTWLPTLVLRLLWKMAWQKACQSALTEGGSHLWSPTFEVSMKVRKTARKVSSSAPSRITARGNSVESNQE